MSSTPPRADGLDFSGIADAVAACPSVLRLTGGMGEVATYLPGRRVNGIRMVDEVVEIHIVARWVAYLPDVADEVRGAVGPLVGDHAVSVFIDDLGVDGDPDGDDRHAVDTAGREANT